MESQKECWNKFNNLIRKLKKNYNRSTMIILVIIGIWFGCIFAQTPEIEWEKILPEGSDCYHVQQTTDKGYIFCGRNLYGHFYLAKTDTLGNFQWQKNYPAERFLNLARCVQQTTDRGYIFVGNTHGDTTYYNFVAKTDSLGNLLWDKKFAKDTTSFYYCIEQTDDGGYIISGEEPERLEKLTVFIMKIDTIGKFRWKKYLPEINRDYQKFIPVQQTKDKGYIIAAGKLIKTDSLGNPKWIKNFRSSCVYSLAFIQQTRDGGYIATGVGASRKNRINNSDVYILKIDPKGKLKWLKTYEGNDYESGEWIKQTRDGGYIVSGGIWRFNEDGYGTSVNSFILKTDSLGNLIWTKKLGVKNRDTFCVQPTEDGGYILVEGGHLIKIKSEMNK